jgi:hypothetical protein
MHTTLAPLRAGDVLAADYHFVNELWSTRMRRHLLRRSKAFRCGCAACAAPDPLAALPCPACTRRDAATGLLPLDVVMDIGQGLKEHAVAIPDGDTSPRDAADAADDPDAYYEHRPERWRCASCGGVFSRAAMRGIVIPAGTPRPQSRTSDVSARAATPASLLDVERWAEAAVYDTLKRAPPHTAHAAAEALAAADAERILALVPLVGTSHVSITRLRLDRLHRIDAHAIGAAQQALQAGDGGAALRQLMSPGMLPTRIFNITPFRADNTAALMALRGSGGAGATSLRADAAAPILAAALVAETESVWQRLREAGAMRPSAMLTDAVGAVVKVTQLVLFLGALHDAKNAGCVQQRIIVWCGLDSSQR